MNKPLNSLPTVYPLEIAKKGTQVYQNISKQIEKNHSGNFVAIEVESGKYFLGSHFKTQQYLKTDLFNN